MTRGTVLCSEQYIALLCFLSDGKIPESLPNKSAKKNFKNSSKAHFEKNGKYFLRKKGREKEVVKSGETREIASRVYSEVHVGRKHTVHCVVKNYFQAEPNNELEDYVRYCVT